MADPVVVAQQVFRYLEEQRWDEAASLTEVHDLQAWYDEFANAKVDDVPPVTAAMLKKHRPDMPDVVAEYQAGQLNAARADTTRFSGLFAEIRSQEDLRRATPREAFADWLRAHDLEFQVRRRFERIPPESRPPLPDRLTPRCSVIGVVHEGSLAHVVYRHSDALPRELGETHVMTLANVDGEWRVLVQGEWFRGIGGGGIVAVTDDKNGEDSA